MLNGCFVLSTSRDFSLKVISRRSHITTHFDVIAYSCGWQISDIRSSVDIWEGGGGGGCVFSVLDSVGLMQLRRRYI